MKTPKRSFLAGVSVGFLLAVAPLSAADWPGFRGPNGSGVATDESVPVELGTEKNLVWRRELAQGTSSPIVVGNRLYLTALDAEELAVFCLDAATGDTIWRRIAPRPRREKFHPNHGPATPTPVSDGDNIYVFFPEFGLLSLTADGEERWKAPLGPFTSVQGMASSPVVADGKVVVLADQTVGAYIAAFDSATGKQIWKQERPTNFLGSYSTPVIYRPEGGPVQVIASGSVELTSYQLETGEKLWWNQGWLAPASVPALGDGFVYVSEPLNQSPPPFTSMGPMDKDKDGALSIDEVSSVSGLEFLIGDIDRKYGNGDGKADADEWKKAFEAFRDAGGLAAIPLGGKGRVDAAKAAWRYGKSLPYLASALLYEGVIYTVREGGIVLALDAKTGDVLKQGRLRDAMEDYYASPVAADGKIYFSSREGKISVVSAGADWEVMSTTDLKERLQATPAISGGRLYVRTDAALYCFGAKGSAPPA